MTYLLIAFFVITAILKIYNTFKEEQEKAAKRFSQQEALRKQQSADRETSTGPQTRPAGYRPQVGRDGAPSAPLPFDYPAGRPVAEPAYTRMEAEPRYERMRAEPTYKTPKYGQEHPRRPARLERTINAAEEMPEEVLRSRQIHKGHKHGFEFPKAAEEVHYQFDIRDAIIKEAILNRPEF